MERRTANGTAVRFSAVLEKMPGRFAWTFVDFPKDVKEVFGKGGVVRVKGTVNGVAMDRALMPTKRGVHIIILGADLRRKARVKVGEEAVFEVRLNMRPDRIDLPEELRATLEFMQEFKVAWKRLRPGMQRSIVIWIEQGRR